MLMVRSLREAQIRPDLALLHALLGHFARQLLDLQKTRIMMSNRISAMERDGLPEEWQLVVQGTLDEVTKAEHGVDLQLSRLAKQHFMADWIKNQPGIGLPGFARLMGITGPLDNFANVAKLWRYMGMSVDGGSAPKRKKGEKVNYSPQGRVLCHQLGDSIVKVGKGPWREAYDVKKAYYEGERPEWTQMHRHNAAMRYAVKELLKAMWIEWMRVQASALVPPMVHLPAFSSQQEACYKIGS